MKAAAADVMIAFFGALAMVGVTRQTAHQQEPDWAWLSDVKAPQQL